MLDAITGSPFFGLTLTAAAWCFGIWVHKKTGLLLFNHMLVAEAVLILFLSVTGISYERYSVGGDMIKTMLGPVTAVLALNIYNQRKKLGEYFLPVVVGCFVGSVTSLISILLLCRLFNLDESLSASILPKSCTTAIAIGIAESRGGVAGIAAGGVIFTGLIGAIFSPWFAKLFKIKDPVAEGLAIGACSHAFGTAKAMEMGELQGAMSSISLCLCGIISSIVCLFL